MTYESTVLADSPTFLWMLNETSGTTATDATGNGHDGTYTGTFTLGNAGPSGVTPNAAGFDGTTGFVSGPAAGTSPSVFTIEGWFNTSAAAGPLGGFSAGASLGNGTYDRMLYVSTTAKLAVYVFDSSAFTDPRSTASVNDGTWHYFAATLDSGGNLTLYLDGSSVASASGYTSLASYNGHWLAGGDTGGATGGGLSAGSTNGIAGDMVAFAVYPVALSSGQVAAHFAAAGSGTTVSGQVSALALAAPAGTPQSSPAVAGQVSLLALAAPAGSLVSSPAVAGQVSLLALAAPAGQVVAGTQVNGAVSALALAAPAGSLAADATVSGPVANLALAAPAGTPQSSGVTVNGAVATLALAAPAGAALNSTAAASLPQNLDRGTGVFTESLSPQGSPQGARYVREGR